MRALIAAFFSRSIARNLGLFAAWAFVMWFGFEAIELAQKGNTSGGDILQLVRDFRGLRRGGSIEPIIESVTTLRWYGPVSAFVAAAPATR